MKSIAYKNSYTELKKSGGHCTLLVRDYVRKTPDNTSLHCENDEGFTFLTPLLFSELPLN